MLLTLPQSTSAAAVAHRSPAEAHAATARCMLRVWPASYVGRQCSGAVGSGRPQPSRRRRLPRTAATPDPMRGSKLFESEIFQKEMNDLGQELNQLSTMIGKFGDFDTEGKKIYVDHMAGLVEQLRVVLTRIQLANDELGNEMLRMQNVQMLSANTNMTMMLEGLEQEMAEMRRVIALEEATSDPATLAAIKAAWQERFKYAANMRVDKLAADPQAMRGSLDPQALKAAQEVAADPSKIEQYRDNPDLLAFLEVLLGRR